MLLAQHVKSRIEAGLTAAGREPFATMPPRTECLW
jgi:hypothetical protein